MKSVKSLLFISIFLIANVASAQVGIGTNNPDSSSILDVSSNSKGLLFPRLTSSQRDAITLPANGLTIYNTTTNVLEINKGTTSLPVWESLGAANPTLTASNGVSIASNNIKLGGTLTENTLIAQGSNTLTFSGTGKVLFNSGVLALGGGAARTIEMERNATANSAGNNLTILAGGATSAATNKNGGNLILSSGIATGTGSSNIMFNTATPGTAGTSNVTPSTKMILLGNGNIGIGTTSPKAKFEVAGEIKVGDLETGIPPQPGMIRFNNATNKFQGYDGNNWIDMH